MMNATNNAKVVHPTAVGLKISDNNIVSSTTNIIMPLEPLDNKATIKKLYFPFNLETQSTKRYFRT